MAERSSPNLALVSLVAGLTGAGIALLLAPRSGKETIAKIGEKTTELKGQTEDKIHRVRDSVNSGIDKTRDSLSEALKKTDRIAREQYDEFSHNTDRPSRRQSPVLRAWEEEI